MSHLVSQVPPEDPRQVRSRAAIQAAAVRLLTDEGPMALTHQRVAQESGVGRATVYRHWPTTRGLLLDAVLGSDLPFFVDPVVPVRPWLLASLRTLADRLSLPDVQAATLTLMHHALWDEDLAGHRDRFLDEVERRLAVALDLARTDEGLSPALDAREASAVLLGPLVHLTAFRQGDVTDDLLRHLVDQVFGDDGDASAVATAAPGR